MSDESRDRTQHAALERVIIGLVGSNAAAGVYDHNPFCFPPFGLNSIKLHAERMGETRVHSLIQYGFGSRPTFPAHGGFGRAI